MTTRHICPGEDAQTGKMSFASQQRMEKYPDLKPGSVSLFGLINDTNREVKLFLDKTPATAPLLSFHPNDNTASLVIRNQDMMRSRILQ